MCPQNLLTGHSLAVNLHCPGEFGTETCEMLVIYWRVRS
jgi:hypothetical protein